MLQIGQNLALDLETAQHLVSIGGSLENFDRDALFKLSVGALGQVNGSHAAAAKFADDCVGTYSLANSIAFVSHESRRSELCKLFENGSVVCQKLFRFATECRIACARFSEHRSLLFN